MATVTAKPDPLLRADEAGALRRWRDLAWLCGIVYRAAPRHAAGWVAAAVVAGIATPVQLWAGGRLVDSVETELSGRVGTSPWLWLALIVVTYTGVRFLDPLRLYLNAVVRERGGPSVQAAVYRQVTGIQLEAYEHQGFYDTVGRITAEIESRAADMARSLQEVLAALPRMIGGGILIFAVDWRIGLISVVPIIPDFYVYFRAGRAEWTILTEQTRDRRVATYIAERLGDRQAAKEIRLWGIGDWLIEQWSRHFLATRDGIRRERLRLRLRSQGVFAISNLVSSAGVLWVILWLGADLSAGDITILMASFLTFGNWFFAVATQLNTLGQASGVASDVRALLEQPVPHQPDGDEADTERPTPARRVARAPGRIDVENLRFTYAGSSAPVIDGIDLAIPAGQRVAIVGENGAGKTTLLKLLLGLYRPDAGEVRLDGVPVLEISPDERHRRLAAVFQHFTRYPLTVAENVILGMDGDRAGVERALVTAGLAGYVREQEAGIDTLLSPDLGGVDLSGGQWQRLAIARAAWRDADVLALDEPTAALDPMAEVALFERFARLADGRTTLLVSHRLGMARLADRILVIERGRVVEDGSHGALLAAGGRYAELWDLQARWYQ